MPEHSFSKKSAVVVVRAGGVDVHTARAERAGEAAAVIVFCRETRVGNLERWI